MRFKDTCSILYTNLRAWFNFDIVSGGKLCNCETMWSCRIFVSNFSYMKCVYTLGYILCRNGMSVWRLAVKATLPNYMFSQLPSGKCSVFELHPLITINLYYTKLLIFNMSTCYQLNNSQTMFRPFSVTWNGRHTYLHPKSFRDKI